jgi:ankyrin repeat protein
MRLYTRRHFLFSAAVLTGSATLGCRAPAAGGDDPRATFLRAVQAGDAAAVRARLAQEASLAAATDDAGRSAFVLAHLAGQAEIAELLREHGIELDLIEAVLAHDWERMVALAEAEPASVDALHPIGGTALWAAARVGAPELYRVRAIGCGWDANPAGGSGFTPPRAALDCPDPLRAYIAVNDLLSNGSDVNAPQQGGDSVLHAAVRRRDARLVRLVVRKRADLDARDADGLTPLDVARESGWGEGVRLLEDHAELPRDHMDARFVFDWNRERAVPLDLSDVPQARQSQVTGSSHFNLPQVKEWLEAEPRLVWSVSTDDELAIEACGHTGHKALIRLHLDHGAPLSLTGAVSLGDVDFARFLLDDDPRRIRERGPHDFALMWYAAIGGGSVEMAELLLAYGVPVDQESLGTTCLHWAAQRGHVDLARYLIERGADLEAVGYKTDAGGQTPLQAAFAREQAAAAQLLKDLGARS